MADFNSDELEFSDPVLSSPAKRAGQRSIEQIFEDAQKDRISSKRVVAQLRFSSGAPSTRMQQSLWVRRLEAFREALGQDVTRPYTGDDLIRFFASILRKSPSRWCTHLHNVMAHGTQLCTPLLAAENTANATPAKMSGPSNKPAPNVNTIITGVKILLAYGQFKWKEADGFKISGHDSTRFGVWLDQAARSGQLVRGQWKKSTWVGFAVLSRLVRTYLARGIDDGTCSWDVTIAKGLSLVLVSALGARPGDVAQSRLYKGTEYMQYRHVELYIEGDEPVFCNMRARITIEFEKGHKTAMNEETTRYFRPLNDPSNTHMCPIALLLIHCLRHSLVSGTSLQDVLDLAWKRADRTVVWLSPDRPILTAFAMSPLRCELDKAAGVDQLRQTIKEMGIVAGMLDCAYSHALRLGSARDVAHLPAREGAGLATDNVRQSLGHKHSSLASGTTERYVGGASEELYNSRAKAPKVPRGREPRFALPTGDLEARGYTSQMLATPSPLPPVPAAATTRRPLASLDVNIPSTPSAAENQRTHFQSIDPAILNDDELAELAGQLSDVAARELEAVILPGSSTYTTRAESELGGFGADIALDRFSATDAQAILVQVANADHLEEAAALFETEGNTTAGPVSAPEEFILRYSRYNIYDNYYLARDWDKSGDMPASIQKHCVTGGSRDPPIPMLHSCKKTPGCPFSTALRGAQKSHHEHCTAARARDLLATPEHFAEVAQFACQYDNCDFVPAPHAGDPKRILANHVRSVHKFAPKACEHGCEPTKLYYESSKYRYHLDTHHSARWPARCSFPDCTHTGTFAVYSSLKYHLKTEHKLQASEIGPYIPPLAAKRSYITGQDCWVEGCPKKPKNQGAMTDHLRGPHRMTLDDAKAMIQEKAQFEDIVTEVKVGKKRAASTKDIKKSQDQPRKQAKASSSKTSD